LFPGFGKESDEVKTKKPIMAGALFLLALLVAAAPASAFSGKTGLTAGPAHAKQLGREKALEQGWQCPADRTDREMRPGRHHAQGLSSGPMEPGYGYGAEYKKPQPKLLEKEQARQAVESYLKLTRNPDFKLGDINDQGPYYEVKLLKRDDGSLVGLVIVDKNTGCLKAML
jgi:hypothetical protein